MTDLDRFLYLIRKGYVDGLDESETKEHQSLYEKLKKADEDSIKFNGIVDEYNARYREILRLTEQIELLKQDSKTNAEIVEKIRNWHNSTQKSLYDENWSVGDVQIWIQRNYNQLQEILKEIK